MHQRGFAPGSASGTCVPSLTVAHPSGHPITGDDLYGTPSPLIDRHALHAHTLSFPHPTTEQPLTLSAPIPEDLRQALEQAFPDGSWKDAIPNS